MAQNHELFSFFRQKTVILRPFARKNFRGTAKSVNLTSRDSEPCRFCSVLHRVGLRLRKNAKSIWLWEA